MKMKTKLITAVSVLLAVILIAGVSSIAANNYGSQNDPLITLSYLNTTATTELTNKINALIDSAKTNIVNQFNDRISVLTAELEARLPNATGTDVTFTLVSLKKNQKLICGVGTEIMLRLGTCTTFGTASPRLIDCSTGAAVTDAGKALTANHMYMVSIAGNGVTATADAKLLVRGSYTIG